MPIAADPRKLADRLAERAGAGARLTPESAMVALRVYADLLERPAIIRIRRSIPPIIFSPYSLIELHVLIAPPRMRNGATVFARRQAPIRKAGSFSQRRDRRAPHRTARSCHAVLRYTLISATGG
jgi:hypothetical protein